MLMAGPVDGSASGVTDSADPQQTAIEIAESLGESEERPRSQITAIVRELGPLVSRELLAETWRVESGGGMLVGDGTRRRSPGGVFFALARRRLPRKARRAIFGTADSAPVSVVIVERLRRNGNTKDEADDDPEESNVIDIGSRSAASPPNGAPSPAASSDADATPAQPVRRRRIVPLGSIAKPAEEAPPPEPPKPEPKPRRTRNRPSPVIHRPVEPRPPEQLELLKVEPERAPEPPPPPSPDEEDDDDLVDLTPARGSRRTTKPPASRADMGPRARSAAPNAAASAARTAAARSALIADAASRAFTEAADRAFAEARKAFTTRGRASHGTAELEREIAGLVDGFVGDILGLLQQAAVESVLAPFEPAAPVKPRRAAAAAPPPSKKKVAKKAAKKPLPKAKGKRPAPRRR